MTTLILAVLSCTVIAQKPTIDWVNIPAGTTTPFSTGNCLNTNQANYNGNNPYTGCPKGVNVLKTLPVGLSLLLQPRGH